MPPNSDWDVGGDYTDPYGPNDPLLQPGGPILSPGMLLTPESPLLGPNEALEENRSDLVELNQEHPDSQRPKNVELAHVLRFLDGYQGIRGANETEYVAPGVDGWVDVIALLQTAENELNRLLTAGGAKGATADMLREKAEILMNSIPPMRAAAQRMQIISTMFANDLGQTKAWFSDDKAALARGNDQTAQTMLDIAAQKTVRDAYNPPIAMIAANHPDVPPVPEVSPDTSGAPTVMPSGLVGPGMGGILGGLKPDGPGSPVKKQWDDAAKNTPQQQSPGEIPTGALDGAADAAQGAGDAAAKAAEGAGSAAKDALGKLLDGNLGEVTPATGVPLGAGLAGAGLNGLGKGGTGSGLGLRAGGGAAPGSPVVKPAEQATAPAKAASGAPASRASVSSGMAGGPGAGAPAAGHGSGAGKTHKANKALHHDKHDLISEGGAVVPVVGDEPKAPAAPGSST